MGLTKGFKTGLLVSVALAFLVMPQTVMASELKRNPENPVALIELLAVFLGHEQAAQWLTLLGLVGYVFTQLRAWIPPTWLAKLPRWVVKLMEVLAGNYQARQKAVSNQLSNIDVEAAEYGGDLDENMRRNAKSLKRWQTICEEDGVERPSNLAGLFNTPEEAATSKNKEDSSE